MMPPLGEFDYEPIKCDIHLQMEDGSVVSETNVKLLRKSVYSEFLEYELSNGSVLLVSKRNVVTCLVTKIDRGEQN